MSDIFMGVRIHRVSGDFYCSDKGIKSLKGCPEIIGGDIYV